MNFGRNFISVLLAFRLISCCSPMAMLPASPYYGIHPQDVKYFNSDVIKCKDGSKSFTRDRLNDGFCDCIDGTDEPGTSACPDGRFYCINQRSAPQLLFSSRVNDHVCDCCDGSDEYDGSIRCPNMCIRDITSSNVENSDLIRAVSSDTNTQKKVRVSLEDLVQKLKELKVVIILEVAFFMMALRLFHRHIRVNHRKELFRVRGF